MKLNSIVPDKLRQYIREYVMYLYNAKMEDGEEDFQWKHPSDIEHPLQPGYPGDLKGFPYDSSQNKLPPHFTRSRSVAKPHFEMKQSELRQIIREEIEKQHVNEESVMWWTTLGLSFASFFMFALGAFGSAIKMEEPPHRLVIDLIKMLFESAKFRMLIARLARDKELVAAAKDPKMRRSKEWIKMVNARLTDEDKAFIKKAYYSRGDIRKRLGGQSKGAISDFLKDLGI